MDRSQRLPCPIPLPEAGSESRRFLEGLEDGTEPFQERGSVIQMVFP
jgi:hypothetical protein